MRTTTTAILALLLSSATALAAAPEIEIDPAGFIHGTVETDSGNEYRGFLRWNDEEAFWDDLFHAGKEDLPYADEVPRGERDRSQIRIFGVRISWGNPWNGGGRQFVARFGDIAELEPRRGGARVTMRNGDVYDLEDTSNDVGATIRVHDPALGLIEIDWDEIDRIRFSPAPADAVPATGRLQGSVESRAGTFTGFVQWDKEECLWTDELDGETEDGDMAIEMGSIRSIERDSRDGAWVELTDGRRFLLEDTNDVDHSTSGIYVEDARYGRVELGWDDFVRADFELTGASGRGYDEYPEIRPLAGKVTDRDGEVLAGEIVFDLDERRTWEMLDGEMDGVEYVIPFGMVKSIERRLGDAIVLLRGGEELELEDTQDVSHDNDGLMVLGGDGGRGRYVAWRDVERVEFD